MKTGFFALCRSLLLSLFLIAGEPGVGNRPAFSRSLPEKADSVERISMMFFVEHGNTNSLDLYSHPSFRNLTERYAFSTLTALPSGFFFAESGVISWSPSEAQFRELQVQAIALPFQARGLASGRQVEGVLRVVARGEVVPGVADSAVLVAPDTIPPTVAAADERLSVAASKISPVLPTEPANWNRRREGHAFDFMIGARGGSGSYTFELIEPSALADKLSPDGRFAWTPDYNTVTSREGVKVFNLRLRIRDTGGQDSISQFMLWVDHVNRPPVVNELPTFYIQYNQLNRFDLSRGGMIADPDGDSLIFKPALQEMPQGMTLSPRGLLEWRPSVRQFNQIREKPIYLTFLVDDYPAGERTVGQLRIDVSQEDLPPEMTLIPEKELFEMKEDEDLHISFFVVDPNGDDDILTFNFVSEIPEIPAEALKKISVNQYEFTWIPGYDFVKEENAVRSFSISFYAVDRSNNRAQKNILVKVQDVEDIEEKDRVLYDQYRTVLERSWDLVQQLNSKEKELEKRYRQAKNGRKNRSIVMASVGGLTGLSPVVFLENPQGQKVMAGIGGTTTATIGTLEASNVLGESPSDIMRDLNYVSQKRNDLLIHGNIFAGKYALPISRRDKGFPTDLRSLTVNLNLQDVAKLELDATWQNPNKATARNIRTVFKDFNPDPRFEPDYTK
jgi:hypothetical protein